MLTANESPGFCSADFRRWICWLIMKTNIYVSLKNILKDSLRHQEPSKRVQLPLESQRDQGCRWRWCCGPSIARKWQLIEWWFPFLVPTPWSPWWLQLCLCLAPKQNKNVHKTVDVLNWKKKSFCIYAALFSMIDG